MEENKIVELQSEIEEETSMEVVTKEGFGTKIINGVKKHKGKIIAGAAGLAIGIIGTAKVLLNGHDEDEAEEVVEDDFEEI